MYLGVIGVISGLIIVKTETIETLSVLMSEASYLPIVGSFLAVFSIGTFTIAGFLFLAAALFTLVTIKIWTRERLCDPEIMIDNASSIECEEKLLSMISADYAVSANRNYNVNEKKAKSLSRALFCLFSAVFVFVSMGMILQLAFLFYGGGNV